MSQARTDAARDVDLALPAKALSPRGFGAVVGFLLGGALAALYQMMFAAIEQRGGPDAGGVAVGAVVGILAGAIGVWVVVALRAWPKARLSWDADGITEWLGGEARAVIAWSAARHAVLETKLQKVRAGQAGPALHSGYAIQVSDGAGTTITVCDGVRNPDWLNSRACRVSDIRPLREALAAAGAGAGEPVAPDERALTRAGWIGFGVVAWLAYAAIVGGAGFIRSAHYGSDRGLGAMAVLLGSVLLLVRAIRPLRAALRARKTRASAASSWLEAALRAGLAVAFAIPALGILAHSH